MTCSAVIFLKQFITLKLLLRYCGIISTKPLVKTGIRSNECTLILLDCISNIGLCNTLRVYCCELFCKWFISLKLCDYEIERRRSHFNRIKRRTCSLICESLGATVPELYEIIYCIINSRSIYATKLVIDTM